MRILILGGGVMQLPAVRLARSKGWRVVVAAAEISGEIAALAESCRQVDLRDREAVTRAALETRREAGLDGVFTAGTDFSTTVAWVAEKLGLPGIPYQAALAATDKSLMRSAFQAAQVPSPRYFTVAAEMKANKALPPKGFSFPLVVKPVDNMGARGVRRVDDRQQLNDALGTALAQSACGRAIVEQYLEGPELSLDALICDGTITVCGVADRHICFAPYFVEMGHTMPSVLEAKLLHRAEAVFVRGIRALGITRGAAKGDIKITAEGPVVGEIAARLSGGYMSGWTYPLASGVEVTAGALNIAAGLPPGDLSARRSWVSAERAFISIPGVVKVMEGLEQARGIAGVEELFVRVSPGQQVQLPVNNMGKCGNLISAAPTRPAALKSVEAAVQSVLVRLDPGNPRTDAFIRGEEQGGFSAFPALSGETARRLDDLPPWFGDPQRFRRRQEDLRILDLPGIGDEVGRDWHGWSLQGACDRVLEITGLQLRPSVGGTPVGGTPLAGTPGVGPAVDETPLAGDPPGRLVLGRVFWNALIKGGVQAGVYVIDSLCDPASQPKQVMRKWLT